MRKEDESAHEYLSRLVNFLDSEPSSITDDLPTVEACIAYRDLVIDVYGVDGLEGVYDVIEEGTDASPYNDFVDKFSIEWRKLETGKKIEEKYINHSFGYTFS